MNRPNPSIFPSNGRHHNFWIVRHFAAFCVIFAHSFELSGKLPHDLLRAIPMLIGISGLGVTLFFIVSGYLVTQSWHRQPSVMVFIWHRLLRLGPGFWVCIAFAVLFGWALSTVQTEQYWSHPQLREYVSGNLLMRNVLVLPGVFQNNPAGSAVTGTFWTLPLEITCYLWVMTVGFFGVMGSRLVATSVCFAALAAVTLWGKYLNVFDATIIPDALPRYYGAFLCGMLLYVWRDRVFAHLLLPTVLLTVVAVVAWYVPPEHALWRWIDLMRVAMIAWFLINAVAAISLVWPEPVGWPDLSYGVYLYGFPIQQYLVFSHPTWDGWMVFAATVALTLPIAAVSWYCVESWALRQKSRLKSSQFLRLEVNA